MKNKTLNRALFTKTRLVLLSIIILGITSCKTSESITRTMMEGVYIKECKSCKKGLFLDGNFSRRLILNSDSTFVLNFYYPHYLDSFKQEYTGNWYIEDNNSLSLYCHKFVQRGVFAPDKQSASIFYVKISNKNKIKISVNANQKQESLKRAK